MTIRDALLQFIASKQSEIEEEISSLVEINSFTENSVGGRHVGERLREIFGVAEGLSCRVEKSEKFADHLIFSSKGDGSAPIALVGHLDTVFPPGVFEGYRSDGELGRGPGALDMKGGLVVMAYALRAIAAVVGLEKIAPIRVVIVADEEIGSPEGAGVIEGAIAGARACLVFESGRKGDAIITRRKGTGSMTATAHGKAAHAGNNHRDGVNAIWAMARFIDRAQMVTDYQTGVTVNVGKVSGGLGKNTVPDSAEARVDLRYTTRAERTSAVAALEAAAADAAASIAGASIDVSWGVARQPLERTDASVALMNLYAKHAASVGLGAIEAPLIGGGSDASTAGAMGIPSIDGLGPRGSGFHTKEEVIELSSLVPKTQALALLLVDHLLQ